MNHISIIRRLFINNAILYRYYNTTHYYARMRYWHIRLMAAIRKEMQEDYTHLKPPAASC